jgi:hypothetical protein
LEGCIQRGNQIIDVFNSNGQTDGVRSDALIEQFFAGQLGVSGTGGMYDK